MSSQKFAIQSKSQIFAFGVLLVSILVTAAYTLHKPHPTDEIPYFYDLVSDNTSEQLGFFETENILLGAVIDKIEFDDIPFETALEEIQSAVPGLMIENQLTTPVPSITLKLVNAPAIEVLRYSTDLAMVRYQIANDDVIEIVPLARPRGPLVTAKWTVPPEILSITEKVGPVNVRSTISTYFSTPPADGFAQYYPRKEILVLRAPIDQLELVDIAFGSTCFIEHSFFDKVRMFLFPSRNLPPQATPAFPTSAPESNPFGEKEIPKTISPDDPFSTP